MPHSIRAAMTPTFRDDFSPDPGGPQVLSAGSGDKAAQWWNDMLSSLLEGLGDACLVTDSRLEVIFANTEARGRDEAAYGLRQGQ